MTSFVWSSSTDFARSTRSVSVTFSICFSRGVLLPCRTSCRKLPPISAEPPSIAEDEPSAATGAMAAIGLRRFFTFAFSFSLSLS